MDVDVKYGGRLLADRYRLPRPADEAPLPVATLAHDTASGQEVTARRVLLPETVEAELLEEDGRHAPSAHGVRAGDGRAARSPADPAVRRALEAALAASRIPDHPRLDQVYDVFVEGDELWVISELVPAQPLAELIAERPLPAHRAAEIAADVLAALRTVHAHGWVHRNLTSSTVVVCEDGRALLTGLAAGAAEEALCGQDLSPEQSAPRPGPARAEGRPRGSIAPAADPAPRGAGGAAAPGLPSAARSPLPAGFHRGDVPTPEDGAAARAARRGAIAAYRAGTQAASARVAAEARGGNGEWWAKDDGRAGAGPYGPQGHPYGIGEPGEARDGAAAGPSGAAELPSGPAAPDTHGPTALPGSRAGTSRPVPTQWSKEEAPPGTAAPSQGPASVPPPGAEDRSRGPGTSLAAERARQARMTVVGAVTERWAPEQAGPVHENWRLAPPVGPSADLWALGVLLFRAVQGHAPYPEDDVAELVRMVCAEPPAFAEECGPLRPVVESLLRQDPTERPDFEVLRGWLRSLIRSAPEPDVGRHTLSGPPSLEPGRPSDPRRLPLLRRRGELVRRRRSGRKAAAAAGPRRTHRRAAPAPKVRPARPAPARREPPPPRVQSSRPPRAEDTGSPRSLGRALLGGVLMLLVAAVLYAMWFMPERDQADDANRRSSVGTPDAPTDPTPEENAPDEPTTGQEPPAAKDQPPDPGPSAPADGFRVHEDDTGFRVAVPKGWDRSGPNGRGQVRFGKGDFEMVVVKGRDSTKEFGTDPMTYQSEDEPELEPFRTSDWSSASGLRRIDVGDTAMAEGTYTWQDSSGRDVYVRNRAMILGGRYHLILVIGPDDERDAVDRWFEGAVDTYRVLR